MALSRAGEARPGPMGRPDHGSIEWADYSRLVIADRPHLSARTIETDRLCHDRVKAWIGDAPFHASHTNSSAA